MKKLLSGLLVGGIVLLQGAMSFATTNHFSINQTFSQGGVADLAATNINMGGAGYFTVDPGYSGEYFDFLLPGGGTFSTNNTQIDGYYFLKSYANGETIGAGNFGNEVSIPWLGQDWDTILVNGQTTGVWGSSHKGFLGFVTQDNLYGWIEYDFIRQGSTSTLTLLDGAYNDVAGADISAGTAPIPEPSTFLLLGAGLGGFAFYRRKAKKQV